jgi:hypothetical protein
MLAGTAHVLASSHSPAFALRRERVAAAGTTVEAVLSGKLADAGRCPTCGARTAGGVS